jgi:hypothetical protein
MDMADMAPNESTFITPGHLRVRHVLRIAGPVVLVIGIILTVIGAASILMDSGSFTPDHFGWLSFVGMPLMFVGGVCTLQGYMGATARYAMRENAPVGVDTINYVAEGTQPAMTTMARAVTTGVRQGLDAQPRTVCAQCHTANDADARFCKACGAPLKA